MNQYIITILVSFLLIAIAMLTISALPYDVIDCGEYPKGIDCYSNSENTNQEMDTLVGSIPSLPILIIIVLIFAFCLQYYLNHNKEQQ